MWFVHALTITITHHNITEYYYYTSKYTRHFAEYNLLSIHFVLCGQQQYFFVEFCCCCCFAVVFPTYSNLRLLLFLVATLEFVFRQWQVTNKQYTIRLCWKICARDIFLRQHTNRTKMKSIKKNNRKLTNC